MSPRMKLRRLAFVTAVGSALMIGHCDIASAASSNFLDGRADEFGFTCVSAPGLSCATTRFWLVLDDGYSDTVGVTVGSNSISDIPRWSLRMPENRYLSWYRKPTGYTSCEQKDYNSLFAPFYAPARTLLCPRSTAVNIRLGDLNDTFVASSLDLTTLFNIFGEDGSDYIRTAKGKDTLSGGNGNDVLRGGAGIDSIFGDADDDILDGGDGADVLDCGDGSDKVQYQGRTSALNVTLDDTANDGASGENDKIGSSCENVEVWNGADKVVGSAGANKLYGNDGDDSLKGGGGSDRLYGGDGKDSLYGEAGNDYLTGDAGDDTIDGGSGADTIYGGSGNDTINAKDGQKDTIYCGTGDYDAVVYDAGLDEIDIGSCERR